MPRTAEDARWFGRLAVTAGICEELLYRGFLLWYLRAWLGIVPAAVVASVVFGLGHAYQGPRGVATTSVLGLFMFAVFLLTGSLFACMLIHALMDLHAGSLARAAFARAEAIPPAGEREGAEDAPAPSAE